MIVWGHMYDDLSWCWSQRKISQSQRKITCRLYDNTNKMLHQKLNSWYMTYLAVRILKLLTLRCLVSGCVLSLYCRLRTCWWYAQVSSPNCTLVIWPHNRSSDWKLNFWQKYYQFTQFSAAKASQPLFWIWPNGPKMAGKALKFTTALYSLWIEHNGHNTEKS